ncbi:putative fatty acid degradation enzyme [Escherichia coli]|nr:putative fatty acid degradation enzyme [Escherichia coli]
MKPHEIERHQAQANHLEIVLHLRADLFWFRGHFAVQPLLPGVAQIDWAMSYAAQSARARLAFSLHSEHKIPVSVAAGKPRHARA